MCASDRKKISVKITIIQLSKTSYVPTAYYTCIVARDCIPADLDSRYGIIVTMQSADYNTNITYTQTGHATEILPCDLTLDIVAHGFELIFVYNNLKCLVWIFGYLVV